MKKDLSIQFVRIFAMFFIILCHFFNEYGFSVLGQMFNVGVFIFIFISGYLYGMKNINYSFKDWIKKRFIKINFPIIIFTVIVLLFSNYSLKNNIIIFTKYFFCLQYFFGGNLGLSHLWFISVIMLCYIIFYFFNNSSKNILLLLNFVLFILAFLFSFVFDDIGMLFYYFFAFFVGVYFSRYNDYTNKFSIFSSVIVMILSIIFRLVGKLIFDETVIYSCFIFSISQLIFAIAFLAFFKKIKFLKNNKFYLYLDKYNFYIYITHYIFMVGPLKIIGLFSFSFWDIILILICTIFSSMLLYYFEKSISKLLKVR